MFHDSFPRLKDAVSQAIDRTTFRVALSHRSGGQLRGHFGRKVEGGNTAQRAGFSKFLAQLIQQVPDLLVKNQKPFFSLKS